MDRNYGAWYCGQPVGGKCDTLKEAQNSVTAHSAYVKSKFTKRGDANSRNTDSKEYFRIYDNGGYNWNIR